MTGQRVKRGLRVLGATVISTSGFGSQAQASPPVVATFEVQNRGAPLDSDVLSRLGDVLYGRLAACGSYRVVPQAEVKERLARQKAESYKQCYDESCQIEVGKELAADKSLSTRVVKVGDRCEVSSTIYDLKTAATEKAAVAEAPCTEGGVRDALVSNVAKLCGQTGAPLLDTARLAPPSSVMGGGKLQEGVTFDRGDDIRNEVTDETGFLLVKTEPPGATIFLNGVELGQSPIQVEKMVGRYVLVAEMGKLFHPARQDVVLKTEGARITLTLPPSFGGIEVTSEPPGADVWLDGEKVGTTPWSTDKKPSGEYQLRVVKSSWLTRTETVRVMDGQVSRRVIVLDQNYGALLVKSDPPGAAITLNDTPTGKTTPTTLEPLQPGIAVVKLKLEGYGDLVEQATVQNRKTATIQASMQAKMGLLAVTSAYADGTPCEGEVLVDGERVGASPWKRQILATTHELRVICKDGSAKETVVVEHNARRSVAVTVQRDSARRWRGQGRQSNGSTWSMEVNIETFAAGRCATVEYPSLGCGGHWECDQRTTPQKLMAREVITFGLGKCMNGGSVELTVTESSADYVWTSRGQRAVGRLLPESERPPTAARAANSGAYSSKGVPLNVGLTSTGKWKTRLMVTCLELRKSCGRVDFQTLGCSADLVYKGIDAGGHLFDQEGMRGRCAHGCQIWISNDGTAYKELCQGRATDSTSLVR